MVLSTMYLNWTMSKHHKNVEGPSYKLPITKFLGTTVHEHGLKHLMCFQKHSLGDENHSV